MALRRFSFLFFLSPMLILFVECSKAEKDPFRIEALDIGLSVKWGNANLGAISPEEFGDQFAWGETTPKTDFSWENYKWFGNEWVDKYNPVVTKYTFKSEEEPGDGLKKLLPEDDAAYATLGGKWRMPTNEECWELLNTGRSIEHRWERDTINGQCGWRITYKPNGNSIFLPLQEHPGKTDLPESHFWASTLYPEKYAVFDWECVIIGDILWITTVQPWEKAHGSTGILRYAGKNIRPVMDY